jgi:hypothetical protein
MYGKQNKNILKIKEEGGKRTTILTVLLDVRRTLPKIKKRKREEDLLDCTT